MSDPKQWVDEDSGSTALEQDLFRAGRRVGMPADEKKQQWAAIAERAALIPAAGAPPPRVGTGGGAASGVAKGGLVKGGLVKSLSILSLVAGAGAGVWAVSHRSLTEPTTVRPPDLATHLAAPIATSNAASAPESAHSASAADESAIEGAPPQPTPVPAVSGHAVAPGQNSRLAEEARAVLDARTELEGGNPGTALRLLEAARVDFPNGSLGQEREALAIEALAASGRKDAASARARGFLRRFPGSPHASNVRRFVVEP